MTRMMQLCLLLPGGCLVGCASHTNGTRTSPLRFHATPWQEADFLFRGDRQWVGGDGAYSIDLENGSVLWLFADSVIDPSASHSRKSDNATMISNTVAIQKGYDPSTAEITFYWQTNAAGKPVPFFPDRGNDRLWPGHGIKIRDRMILFLMRVRSIPSGLGFEVYDWDAVLVRNPEAEPDAWDMIWLDSPANDLQVIVGSASVLAEGDFVYAYSSKEPSGGDVYLVRWPLQSIYEGDLKDMEWWNESGVWTVAGTQDHRPTPVLRDAGTEFTVHRDPGTGQYLQVQCTGFGPAVLTLRQAPHLTGPWSMGRMLYRPPEHNKPRIMIYQGKAHPHLTGAELVLTYSTNSFDFQNLIDDDAIYYPRFVRLCTDRSESLRQNGTRKKGRHPCH